ncbi:hypothetical protein GP486_001322 [Trichoglossum hirsutum]|uniref:D-lactate dehydratase n=1 Tax=Trichoglossum hirsutum TaxID=265104 RepID=A0A9P8LH28_9PEZI|nr:hypothetical protein GP486_001322 [Trichoglossum hirsutum]
MPQPTALILIADGSEEIEFVTCYDVLVRAGVDVKSVGVNLKNGEFAVCSRNTKIIPDVPSISSISSTPNVLILPGGLPGSQTFCDTPAVLDLIRQCNAAGSYTAFICAATIALVAAYKRPLEGVVTSHPSVKEKVVEAGWEYGEERVMVSGKVITSRGPGTAMLFALTVVEVLLGKEKTDEVARPMMLAQTI